MTIAAWLVIMYYTYVNNVIHACVHVNNKMIIINDNSDNDNNNNKHTRTHAPASRQITELCAEYSLTMQSRRTVGTEWMHVENRV